MQAVSVDNAICSHQKKQLKEARERVRALEETNSILTAYLGFLIMKYGEVELPKRLVRDGLGNFGIRLTSVGDNYLVKAVQANEEPLCLEEKVTVGEREGDA